MSNISIHHLAFEGKNTKLLKLSLPRDGPKTMGKNGKIMHASGD